MLNRASANAGSLEKCRPRSYCSCLSSIQTPIPVLMAKQESSPDSTEKPMLPFLPGESMMIHWPSVNWLGVIFGDSWFGCSFRPTNCFITRLVKTGLELFSLTRSTRISLAWDDVGGVGAVVDGAEFGFDWGAVAAFADLFLADAEVDELAGGVAAVWAFWVCGFHCRVPGFGCSFRPTNCFITKLVGLGVQNGEDGGTTWEVEC